MRIFKEVIFGPQFEVQTKNKFCFILTGKFGFLCTKLNLSLGLGGCFEKFD